MLVLLLIAPLLYSIEDAVADDLNPGVFGVNESPYGKTYEDWTMEWWKWLVSYPNDINPALVRTGENCEKGLSASEFSGNPVPITGTGGGFKEVECKIPEGSSLFFPVMAVVCTYAESPGFQTEEDLHECATSDQDSVTSLNARIDGVEIKNLEMYRIHSGLFDLTFPENNIFGVQEGPTEGVSDGYWVFLKPFEKGSHVVEFSATLGECTVTSAQCLTERSIYHVEVG